MSFFRPNLDVFVGISRNDEELKDLDESDTKSTVFSGNLRNCRKTSENFNGLLSILFSDEDFFLLLAPGARLIVVEACGVPPPGRMKA